MKSDDSERGENIGFQSSVIGRADDAPENAAGKAGLSDEEIDPQQEEDLLDLMEVAIEQEVGNLLENSDDVFSDDDISSELQETALEEKSGNSRDMEVFLEHLIKKIVSEKIDDMVIDERRVVDVIEKAVTKERDRLIRELSGDG